MYTACAVFRVMPRSSIFHAMVLPPESSLTSTRLWLPTSAGSMCSHVRGFFRTRIRPLAVHFAEGAVCGGHHRLTGVGADPVFLTLELDDGSQVVLAAPRSVKSLVVGPYLAALLSAGPRGGGGTGGSTRR